MIDDYFYFCHFQEMTQQQFWNSACKIEGRCDACGVYGQLARLESKAIEYLCFVCFASVAATHFTPWRFKRLLAEIYYNDSVRFPDEHKRGRKGRSKPRVDRYYSEREGSNFSIKTKQRFGWRCVLCKERADHAHHILSYAKYPEIREWIYNGLPLCLKHHRWWHQVFGQVPTIADYGSPMFVHLMANGGSYEKPRG